MQVETVRRMLLRALIVGSALIILLVIVSIARAHDWYDPECCSGKDCAPMVPLSVIATDGGWQIKATGEVIPFGDKRERRSMDDQFHRCPYPGGKTRCLYVPGAGT